MVLNFIKWEFVERYGAKFKGRSKVFASAKKGRARGQHAKAALRGLI